MRFSAWGVFALAAAAGAVAAWGVTGARRFVPASLKDQVVWITGGSRGLGLCIARELAAQGCKLALSARDLDELTRARWDLEKAYPGVEVLTIECDVTDLDEVELACARVTRHYGQIDGLVAVAGVIQVGPAEAMTIDDYRHSLEVNLFGVLHAVEAVLPDFRSRGRGFICAIDSIGGRISMPHLLPYHTSKFALRGLMEGLNVELAKDGIAVTTIMPGLMRTGSPVNAQFKGNAAKEFAWFGLDDSLPGLSMSAPAAAKRVVEAIRYGEREVTLGLAAALGGLVHDVLPGMTLAALEVVNGLLPGHEGPPNQGTRGWDLRDTFVGPLVGFIGALGDRYNELGPYARDSK